MSRWLVAVALAASIAGLVAAPAGAGGGAHCEGISDGATTTVALAKNCFMPTITRIDPGDEVRFVNKDPVPHTVTGTLLRWGDLNELAEGDDVSYRFDEDGIYPYTCIIHPGMVGAIVVGDGEGASSSSVSYVPTGSSEAQEPGSATSGQEGTSATADKGTSVWSIALAMAGALAALLLSSAQLRKRLRAGITLTTKP